jgi:hypothetical protein
VVEIQVRLPSLAFFILISNTQEEIYVTEIKNILKPEIENIEEEM